MKDRTERHVSVTISIRWSHYNQLLDIADATGKSLSAVASQFIEEGIDKGAAALDFEASPGDEPSIRPAREMTPEEEAEYLTSAKS